MSISLFYQLKNIKESNDYNSQFGLIVFNKKLKKSLYVNCISMDFDSPKIIDFEVYDTKSKLKPQELMNSDLKAIQMDGTPIAVAAMKIHDTYLNIDKLYVGREYRRKGIGSMLVELCEDLCHVVGREKESLYAIRNFHFDDYDINEIRKKYGKTSHFENVVESFLMKKNEITKKDGLNKFLEANGFMVSKNPYDNPRKNAIRNSGYLTQDSTQEASSQPLLCRFNVDEFVGLLNNSNTQCEK